MRTSGSVTPSVLDDQPGSDSQAQNLRRFSKMLGSGSVRWSSGGGRGRLPPAEVVRRAAALFCLWNLHSRHMMCAMFIAWADKCSSSSSKKLRAAPHLRMLGSSIWWLLGVGDAKARFQSFCYFVRSRSLIFMSKVLTEWRLVAHSLRILYAQSIKRMIARGKGRAVSEAFEAWSNCIYLKSHIGKSMRIFRDRARLNTIRLGWKALEVNSIGSMHSNEEVKKRIKDMNMGLKRYACREWGRLTRANLRLEEKSCALLVKYNLRLLNIAWREFNQSIKVMVYDEKITRTMGNILTFDAFKRFIRAWKDAVMYLKSRRVALEFGIKAFNRKMMKQSILALQDEYMRGAQIKKKAGKECMLLGWRVGFKTVVSWQGWVKRTEDNRHKRDRYAEMDRLGRRMRKRLHLHAWAEGRFKMHERRKSTIEVCPRAHLLFACVRNVYLYVYVCAHARQAHAVCNVTKQSSRGPTHFHP